MDKAEKRKKHNFDKLMDFMLGTTIDGNGNRVGKSRGTKIEHGRDQTVKFMREQDPAYILKLMHAYLDVPYALAFIEHYARLHKKAVEELSEDDIREVQNLLKAAEVHVS